MKKLTTVFAVLLIFVFSCQKADQPEAINEETPSITDRTCASHEILEQELATDPVRKRNLEDLETLTQRFADRTDAQRTTAVTIPVFVHVVWNTNSQNISDAQIQAQIDVLNEDFTYTNADKSKIPSSFLDEAASANIQFSWNPNDIRRVKTKKRSFGTDNSVKFSSKGGSDVVDPANYLNIWVCNLGRGLLGYAQFPGGNASTDGIVVLYSSVGSKTKYPSGTYVNNYNLGRTATHEVGHYLNLRHIWGDATCGNDQVADTPEHNTSNGGCPAYPHYSTCSGSPIEMTMNYMDYTYDACMYMFTAGQGTRMNAVFAGPRSSLVN